MGSGRQAATEAGAAKARPGPAARPSRVAPAWLLAVLALALVAAACGEDTATGLAETSADGPDTQESDTQESDARGADGETGTTTTTEATTTTTSEPTTSTTAAATTTEPPLTASGVAFASAINATGKAIDPGVEFPATVSRVYAVFHAESLPRGLELNVDDIHPDGYYAYLRTSASSNLSTFGWRWFHNGEMVVEYEADAAASEFFWLERFDRSGAGIFGAPAATGMGPGLYTVEFTVSGNALFEESFTITP